MARGWNKLMLPVESCLVWEGSLHGDSRVWGPRECRRFDEPRTHATEGTNSTRLSNKMGKELESWCSEKQRNKLLEQAMIPALSRSAWIAVFV
ncbi:hypothetical protein GWK47_046953 [Chionoecetes opilio]|uniref:Uncharacterized protein n=1 Tax=Chionoecetes opilio TaxID=41210 RepID=A0A8J4YE52_CHIOP|nr:hypothetical protein GWK47_046953 [Chionoecetes opilio]